MKIILFVWAFFLCEVRIFGSSIPFGYDKEILSESYFTYWDEFRLKLNRLGSNPTEIADKIGARAHYQTVRKFLNGDIKKSPLILQKYQNWIDANNTDKINGLKMKSLDDWDEMTFKFGQLKVKELENYSDCFNTLSTSDHIDLSHKMITSDALLEEIEDDWLPSDEPIIGKPFSYFLNHITRLGDTFSKLDISHNRLLDDGLYLLAEALENHQKLRFMSVAYNDAASQGVYDFLMKIFTFSFVPYIDIRGNFGADLKCVKRVLNALNADQQTEFKTKIIWYGTEPFQWE